MVEELKSYSLRDIEDMDSLMHELSETSFCNEEKLSRAVADANTHVFVIRDNGRIVATGTLCVMHTPEFAIAGIESVVVSAKSRGKGCGRELMQRMIGFAGEQNVHHIHLTSNPARAAANRLYQALGFQQYTTNCYKLYLQRDGES